MNKFANLPADDTDRLVQEIAAPVDAPLVMTRQVLESSRPLTLRRLFTSVFNLRPASHQEM